MGGLPLEDIAFAGELRDEQRLAARELVWHDTGVLAAETAFGKTVLAAWLSPTNSAHRLFFKVKVELP